MRASHHRFASEGTVNSTLIVSLVPTIFKQHSSFAFRPMSLLWLSFCFPESTLITLRRGIMICPPCFVVFAYQNRLVGWSKKDKNTTAKHKSGRTFNFGSRKTMLLQSFAQNKWRDLVDPLWYSVIWLPDFSITRWFSRGSASGFSSSGISGISILVCRLIMAFMDTRALWPAALTWEGKQGIPLSREERHKQKGREQYESTHLFVVLVCLYDLFDDLFAANTGDQFCVLFIGRRNIIQCLDGFDN